jgi:uncharacterized protein (DUF1330 family)
MTAFVILDIDVHDPVTYEEYKKLAPPSIAAYGGRYVARGGKVETLEGNWQPQRIVVLEFESMEKAKTWLNSPEYHPAHEMRTQSAHTRSILVEGI